MRWKKISDAVVRRLPVYLRVLEEAKAEGMDLLPSNELGERAGVSPALVRKDLAWFGEFGKQGVGYDVEYLGGELRKILNLDKGIDMVLVGVGSLGHALARYNIRRHKEDPNFSLRIVALFDVDPDIVGEEVAGIPVRPLSELQDFVGDKKIQMAIIAVPSDQAQSVADQLVAVGVKAILNFAPVKLNTPEDVKVSNADLSLELQTLAYYL